MKVAREMKMAYYELFYVQKAIEITEKNRELLKLLTQIAETTPLMLSDIQSLGARIYKIHRVYRRDL